MNWHCSMYGKMKVWAHWNHSFHMCLNYLGPVFCFSPSWVLGMHYWRWLQWLKTSWSQHHLFIDKVAIFFCPHKTYVKFQSKMVTHRGLLNSLPPMDTPNLYLHVDHFFWNKSRDQLNDFYTSWANKKIHEKTGRKDWVLLPCTLSSSQSNTQLGRETLRSKGCDPESSTTTFKASTWRVGPLNTYFKSHWGFSPQDPLDDSKQETVLNRLKRTHCGSPL